MSVAGSDGSDRSQQAAPGPTRAGIDQRFPHALSLKVCSRYGFARYLN